MFLEVKALNKFYGQKESRAQVLKDVTFGLEKGSFCTLFGPSGSGKSTLLNIIGGLEVSDGGSVAVDGQELSGLKSRELGLYRREKLGFVFQFYNLLQDLSCRENIEVCAELSKDPLDLDELLEHLGLSEHQHKFPFQLSGGQQQRCAIGRALVKHPALLICDEPTGALDYSSSKEILALLEGINQRYNTTVLLATHNQTIEEMSDVVLKLRDGELVSREDRPFKTPAVELEW